MTDYIVRATAADARIRAFAATAAETVETARQAHDLSPVMTAALGRLLVAGGMMGMTLKGDQDLLTLQVRGDGPAGGLTVTADAKGSVKGYAQEPQVLLPANARGKLDVGGAVGQGTLTVVRDMGMKEPYAGQVALQTGEIAEDLTYYFAVSEQVPSSVGLGVLMNRENTVRRAGGFLIQLMPFAEEETVSALEQNLQEIRSVTSLLEEGRSPEDILALALKGLNPEIEEKKPLRFTCNCSRERVEKALVSIGEKELRDMIADGEEITVNCHFCNQNYTFTVEELKDLLKHSSRPDGEQIG